MARRGTAGLGARRAVSTYKLVWTNADRRRPSARRVEALYIVAGMPRPMIARRARPRAGRRVLLMSSFVHRDLQVNGRFPHVAAQAELLSIVDAFDPVTVTLSLATPPR